MKSVILDYGPQSDWPERYGRVLQNTTYLANYMATDPSEYDIQILLKMELIDKRRDFIISRLLGRLTTLFRRNAQQDVDNYMKEN